MPNAAAIVYSLYKNPIALLTRDHYTKDLVIDRMFGLRALSLNDPGYIRQVFITNRHKYGIDPIRKLLLKRSFSRGLAAVEGDEWHTLRRLSAVQFSSRKLARYAVDIAAICDRFCLRQPDRQSVSLASLATGLALENGMRCLFSKDRDGSFEPMSETNSNYLEHVLAIDVADILQAPAELPRLMKRRVGRILRRHGAIVETLYRQRQERIRSGAGAPDDLLTGICRHFISNTGYGDGRRAALDNIGTMLGASYDTTGKVIAWALYLLAMTPDALSAVRDEVDAGRHDHVSPQQWPSVLPHVLATIRETLRLYPAIPGMARHALEGDRLGPHPVRKGDYLVASTWLLQRSDRHWNEGSRFRIGRFLPGGEADGKADCYMPFGVGPRMCIGRAFAELESVIVLARLVREFDFRYASAEPPQPVWRGTLRSNNGIPVIMTRRGRH